MGKRSLCLASVMTLIGVVLAGCTGAAAPARRASGRVTTSPSTTLRSGPTTTTTTATAVAPGQPSNPGVLAACTGPPPETLTVRPSSIIVACADAGIGAQDLTWSSWTSTGAIGSGEVWWNDCTPDCASGAYKYYPASITLSGVQSSADGAAFTVLSATYSGAEPNGNRTDTFHLELPQG